VLPATPLSLLVLALLQGSPLSQPSSAAECQEVQRIELSLAPGASHEICVSQGLLTAFVFESPVVMDLQDEPRFAEVTRGRISIALIPPGDMAPGERLRLTVGFADGSSSDTITFMLVAHAGQATRQVEVYRDKRTRESLLQEVTQERAKNARLQEHVEQLQHQFELLRADCDDPGGLRRLIVSKTMGGGGILARAFNQEHLKNSEGILIVEKGMSYHSASLVAVETVLRNSSSEPWIAEEALLVDAKGKEWRAVRLWQAAPILPRESRQVVVEVETSLGEPRGDVTVVLRGSGARGISIPGVTIP
jgi:uncharacterized protein (TIGR02268 family)